MTVKGWEATTDPETQKALFLSPQTELSNDDVVSTGVQRDDYGLWQVVIILTDPGKKKFAELSADLVDAKNVKTTGSTSKRLAVIIDGKVIFAPYVTKPITGGVIHLSSNQFTEQSARRLAQGIVRK